MTDEVRLLHADDLVVMRIRLQDSKEVFTSQVVQTNKMGLEICKKKTL